MPYRCIPDFVGVGISQDQLAQLILHDEKLEYPASSVKTRVRALLASLSPVEGNVGIDAAGSELLPVRR
jgi:hypothetical protein